MHVRYAMAGLDTIVSVDSNDGASPDSSSAVPSARFCPLVGIYWLAPDGDKHAGGGVAD